MTAPRDSDDAALIDEYLAADVRILADVEWLNAFYRRLRRRLGAMSGLWLTVLPRRVARRAGLHRRRYRSGARRR